MEHRSYPTTQASAWGLTLAVAVLAISGMTALFLHQGDPLKDTLVSTSIFALAGIVACALVLANCMASHAQRALVPDEKRWATFWIAGIAALGLSITSMVGVHLGWQLLEIRVAENITLPPPEAVALAAMFLAFVKPAANFVLASTGATEEIIFHESRVRAGKRYMARPNEGLDRAIFGPPASETAAPEAPVKKPELAVAPPAAAPVVATISPFGVTFTRERAQTSELREVAPTVAALARAALNEGVQKLRVARNGTPEVTIDPALGGMTVEQRDQLFAQRRALVRDLWRAGSDVSDIVDSTGIPRSSVKRYVAAIAKDEQKQIAA